MDPLRERREAVVREHMESETEHDLDGDVHDGREEVMAYFTATRAGTDPRPERVTSCL